MPRASLAPHVELTATVREIANLSKRRAEAERRADYLRHVVHEIGDAKLLDGEDVRLEDEARRLENADELRALAGGLASTLDGDEDAVLQRLGGDLATAVVDPEESIRRCRVCRTCSTPPTTPSKRSPAS